MTHGSYGPDIDHFTYGVSYFALCNQNARPSEGHVHVASSSN